MNAGESRISLAAPEQPWLLVFEFQAQPDPEKMDATLVEAAQFRCALRHGPDRSGKYKVLVALVYLRGTCPEDQLDMMLPSGHGTCHRPLVWNVADDSAAAALAEVEGGQDSWGLLFWLSLMAEDGDTRTGTRTGTFKFLGKTLDVPVVKTLDVPVVRLLRLHRITSPTAEVYP